ncbi:hypothetical protein SteCoe_25627 [Stentor coeruleus]|uniref:Poly(A) RNA polymerase mitochondrial-like central palm domain-containing protein n=1 Tax=Stentor coeruleus TaxID=5963 RepID=A0A1R2BET5_9CILI|nr:hypothetical protein SteCoe_25627 [Stentor coeruleus]
MEILESYLRKSSTKKFYEEHKQEFSDEFFVGMICQDCLSNPTLENARILLDLSTHLSSLVKEKTLLALVHVLQAILENSHKQKEIESLFECTSYVCLQTNTPQVILKLRHLFDSLLERVDCSLGLTLLDIYKKHLKFEDHYASKLSNVNLEHLDVKAECSPADRFKVAKLVYEICLEKEGYDVLNMIAYRCIDHVLRYEINDFTGYAPNIENQLMKVKDKLSYEERVKISKIYKNGINKIKCEVNNALIRELESLKFMDSMHINPQAMDFTYLIEDLLQFNLSDQVIRNRLKSLHGKYKGKVFAGELSNALKAVRDDEPGYRAMNRISSVLKPLKLLSKIEYKKYKRNERIINCHEPKYEEIKTIENVNFDSLSKAAEKVQELNEKTGTKNIEEINKFIVEIQELVKEKYNDAVVILFGSYSTNLAILSSGVDISINSSSIEDKESFLIALQVKLAKKGSVSLVESKSLPVITFKPNDQNLVYFISISNSNGIESSDLIRKYIKKHEKISELIKVVKAWANENNLNKPSKGTYSGYEWALLVIGFLQSLKILPLYTNEEIPEIIINQSVGELFFRFIHFCYQLDGDKVCLKNGIIKDKAETLMTVVNPIGEKVFFSRVKRNRKQGKAIVELLVKTLETFSS